jgi:hypothetical protein
VRKAFSLATPKDGQAVSGGFVMEDGNYALVLLEEVQDGQLESLDEPARMQVLQELGKVQGTSDMIAVMAALKEKAAIHIPESGDQP